MTTLIICLLIAILLPYLAKLPLVKAQNELGRYDNHHPRTQQAMLTGYGARTLAAHQNSFEALAVFSTAVLTAIATNHVSSIVQILAVAFIVLRVIYHVLYLRDMASLRSTVWFFSYVCCVTILCFCLY